LGDNKRGSEYAPRKLVEENGMQPRERFETAVEHREPDQIPWGLGAITSSGIGIDAYTELLTYLGQPTNDAEIEFPIQRLARLPEPFLEEWGVDLRGIEPRPITHRVSQNGYEILSDEWGITWKRLNRPGSEFYQISAPLSSATITTDIDNYKWPDPGNPLLFEGLRRKAESHWDAGFPVILNHWTCGIMELSAYLRGYEQFMKDLIYNPGLIQHLMSRVLELKQEFFEKYLSVTMPYVSAVKNNDDMGSQTGLLISPAMYRKFVKPLHIRLFQSIKRMSNNRARIILHSCGSIEKLIPDFIEEGVDILNPVQISCPHMVPETLKRQFGREITFFGGGVRGQTTLASGSPEDVRREVKHNIEAFAPGGGFIFAATIPPLAPAENLVAMKEAFHDHRHYA